MNIFSPSAFLVEVEEHLFHVIRPPPSPWGAAVAIGNHEHFSLEVPSIILYKLLTQWWNVFASICSRRTISIHFRTFRSSLSSAGGRRGCDEKWHTKNTITNQSFAIGEQLLALLGKSYGWGGEHSRTENPNLTAEKVVKIKSLKITPARNKWQKIKFRSGCGSASCIFHSPTHKPTKPTISECVCASE